MEKNLNVFKQGELNKLTQYFTGNSYVAWLSREQVKIANVTFEPGCINNWHIHHAESGGGQMLLIRKIRNNGTAAEIEIFPGLPHGFGLGKGTIAEGWINKAAEFWIDNIK